MTVYVDDARIPARVGSISGRWSHLTADTKTELFEFAVALGLRRSWFQTCKRSRACKPADQCVHWHFDVTDAKRSEAIRRGAVPVDMRQMGAIIKVRRETQALQEGRSTVDREVGAGRSRAADLPDGTIVATADTAWIRNHPSTWSQWRGTNGAHRGDTAMDDLLAAGAVVLRRGVPGNGGPTPAQVETATGVPAGA